MKRKTAAIGMAVFLGLLAVSMVRAQTKPLSPAAIDQTIRAEWKKEKITSAARVDDARFLRRVTLDITGVIPPSEAITAFLADKSPNKRVRVVEELLASPRYAAHWTNYWDSVLMGRQVRSPFVDRGAFRQWLKRQFTENTPYDKFVTELVTATGQNSAGGSYAKAMGLRVPGEAMEMKADAGAGGTGGKINGAVNWTLKYAQTTADLAGTVSKTFLGVQIQCAQCHDHKTEKWTQENFKQFAACFTTTRPAPLDMGNVRGIRRVELRDTRFPLPGGRRNMDRAAYARATPMALDGTDFSTSPSRRQALAAWMTAPENPWFAQAIVNRMWAYFLGRGFLDPIDDFRQTNPPVMPHLLKRLAEDFTAHNYDLKYLIRTLCATQVYQLASAPPSKADPDNKLWARFRLQPMAPEQLLDSLIAATNLQAVLEKVAGGNLDNLKFLMQRQFVFLFDVDEEFEQKEFEGTIPQALLLLNGQITNRGASPIPGTALAETLALSGGAEQKIESLYLRTLSRKPTAAELKKWVAFVRAPREVVTSEPDRGGFLRPRRPGANVPPMRRAGGQDPLSRLGGRFAAAGQTPEQQAYEDLFWALLNSSEFAFNH